MAYSNGGTILALLVVCLDLAAAMPQGPAHNPVKFAAPLPIDCGKTGKPACNASCNTGKYTAWLNAREAPPCPRYKLLPTGCTAGLTRVQVTPDFDRMPDMCLKLPQAGRQCGANGQACCLTATAAVNPHENIRAECSTGLTCIVRNQASIPYGSSKHLQNILKSGSTTAALLSTWIMGSCETLDDASEVEAPRVHHNGIRKNNQTMRAAWLMAVNAALYKPCDYAHLCSKGSYCAGNEDHYLSGARCLPLPLCGGANQPCCPPNAHGNFHHEYSIFQSVNTAEQLVTQRTPMPYCSDPDSICLWEPSATDISRPRPQNDLQPRPPQASYSMSVTYRSATCIPGLRQCGAAGQPCCPHAQFAISNTLMFLRSHVCDPGLKCNTTIDMSVVPAVLGVCVGELRPCGGLGQQCCEDTDAAGWTWKTCQAGQPGVYCSKTDNVCSACPVGPGNLSVVEAVDVHNAC